MISLEMQDEASQSPEHSKIIGDKSEAIDSGHSRLGQRNIGVSQKPQTRFEKFGQPREVALSLEGQEKMHSCWDEYMGAG